MKVLAIVLLSLIISALIFYISSTTHRIGYAAFIALGIYLLVRSGSAHKSRFYDFAAYCFLAVFIYCIIGIVEVIIRIFNRDFTFGRFITEKLSPSKVKKGLEQKGEFSVQLNSENVNRQNGYGKSEVNDLLSIRESVQNDELESQENSSFVYNEHLYLFSRRTKFFDSDMEKKIYPIIRTFINDKYPVFAHVPLRDVFYWGKWEDNWMLTNRVNGMHFDVVIFENFIDELVPVLFIEIQGEKHYTDPKTMERDQFKEKLVEKCNFKLVTINVSETIPDEKINEMVIQCIKEKVPSRDDYQVYCPLCKEPMIIRSRNDGKGYFYGCSKWKHDGIGCPGSRSISDIPPLYDGIAIKRDIV